MAKKFRRILSLVVALCLCASFMPLQALAATETDTQTSTEISPEGLATEITTTTTTETDGAGNTTVTVTVDKETAGTTAEGVELNREEVYTSTETTSEEKEAFTEDLGSKTETKEEGFVADEDAQWEESSEDAQWEETGKDVGEDFVAPDPLPDPVPSTEVKGELTPDFVDEDAPVDMWMTPENTTDEEKVDLKLGDTYIVDILPEDLDLTGIEPDENGVYTLPDGGTVTKTMEDGKLTYTITNVAPVEKDPLTQEEKEAILDANAKDPVVTDKGDVYYEYYDYDLPDTYAAGSVTNADGGRTDTTVEDSELEGKSTIVEKIYDKNGKLVQEIIRTPVKVNGKIGYEITTKTYSSASYTENDGIISDKTTSKEDRTEMPKDLPAPAAVTKDGQTTKVTFESVLDAAGKHAGYKAVTTVTDKDGNVISTKEEIINEEEYSYEADKDTDNNLTTTVTVTKLMKDGKHIGYTTITTVTDKDGNVISKKSNSVEQTTYSNGSVTETTVGERIESVTTETTLIVGANKVQDQTIKQETSFEDKTSQSVSKEVYQLVETEDGLFMIFQGKLYKIEGTTEYLKNADGSDKSEFAATPDTVLPWSDYTTADDLIMSSSDTYKTGAKLPNDASGDNWSKYKWELTGYGLFSSLKPVDNKGNNKRVRQFMLTDKNGKTILAYCAEMGNDILQGGNYGQADFEKGNAADDATKIDGKNASGTIANLRSIVTNGYWGTESGLGSLQAVKDLMLRNGIAKEYVDALTPGMAVVATQIAIWEFAKDEGNGYFGALKRDADGNLLTDTYIDENGDEVVFETGEREYFDLNQFNAPASELEEAAVGELRNLLVKLAKNPVEGQAELITKDKVTGAGISLKGYAGENEAGKRQYTADVKFGLDVSTSSINGDLIVKVKVGDKVVGKARLAGDSGEDNTMLADLMDKALGTIYPDENGVFTIPGIMLTEGVRVNICLEGIQHMDDGVYLLKDANAYETDWQDFVTLTRKSATVNINMELDFTGVEDPNFTHTTQTWDESKVTTEYYTKETTGVKKLQGTWQSGETTTADCLVGYTSTVTTECKTEGKQVESLEFFYEEPKTPYVPADPVYRLVNDDTVTIEDEEVPLAAAPETGDMTALWIGIIVAVSVSLCAFNAFTKKREQNVF